MTDVTCYERFPLRITLPIILFSLVMYAFGAFLLLRLHPVVSLLYLVYCAGVELNVMYRSCRSCVYYGKRCAFGKGWLAARLFSQGDPASFATKDVSALNLIPDFLVVVFPVVGGLISLVFAFSWVILGLIVVFLVVFLVGTATIRGKAACRYCMQRERGCPAAQMFARYREIPTEDEPIADEPRPTPSVRGSSREAPRRRPRALSAETAAAVPPARRPRRWSRRLASSYRAKDAFVPGFLYAETMSDRIACSSSMASLFETRGVPCDRPTADKKTTILYCFLSNSQPPCTLWLLLLIYVVG